MLANSGIKNGLFLGIAAIIYSHVCYMINPKWMFSGVAFFLYVIILYFMFRATVDEKAMNEGFISFGEALKVTFLTYIIGTFISTIYVYLMTNVIDPGLQEVAIEVARESAESVTKLFGGGEEEIDKIHEQLDGQDMSMSLPMTFLNYLVSLIFPGFILALVMSAIRKNTSANNA